MNLPYKKILVPIDGSKNSLKALSHAATMANSCNAELTILYVSVLSQQVPLYEQAKGSTIPPNASTDPVNFAKKILDEALNHIPEGTQVKTHNEIGEPRVTIVEFAEHNRYDVIVVGSRGLGTISGLLLGSVSTYVIRNSNCPVLVVK